MFFLLSNNVRTPMRKREKNIRGPTYYFLHARRVLSVVLNCRTRREKKKNYVNYVVIYRLTAVHFKCKLAGRKIR